MRIFKKEKIIEKEKVRIVNNSVASVALETAKTSIPALVELKKYSAALIIFQHFLSRCNFVIHEFGKDFYFFEQDGKGYLSIRVDLIKEIIKEL